MSRGKHTEAQMIGALKQMEAGRKAEDVAREMGVSKHTIYAWKAPRAGGSKWMYGSAESRNPADRHTCATAIPDWIDSALSQVSQGHLCFSIDCDLHRGGQSGRCIYSPAIKAGTKLAHRVSIRTATIGSSKGGFVFCTFVCVPLQSGLRSRLTGLGAATASWPGLLLLQA